jgi:uncharacterized protein (DUF2141 family)
MVRGLIGGAVVALALAFSLPAGQAQADGSQVVVRIEGLRSASGFVRLGLYDSPDDFPRGRPVAGQAVPAMSGSVEAVFDDLPDGRYAIAVYHDEDGDGEFTKNFVGLPLEGYGFSNDAPVLLGPPAFDTAAIDVRGRTRTAIRARY